MSRIKSLPLTPLFSFLHADTIDFYINFVFLLTGFFETLGAGWIYNIDQQVASLGRETVVAYMFTHFGSIIIACGFWFGLKNDSEVWGGFVALIVSAIVGLATTGFFLQQKMQEEPGKWTWGSIIYELTLGNVMNLREELSSVVGYLPWVWAFALKNIIPQSLLILFINLSQSNNADGDSLFGHYEGYIAWPFQVLGIFVVCFASIFVLIGFVVPDVFAAADITHDKRKQLPESGEKVVSEHESEYIEKDPKSDPSNTEAVMEIEA